MWAILKCGGVAGGGGVVYPSQPVDGYAVEFLKNLDI